MFQQAEPVNGLAVVIKQVIQGGDGIDERTVPVAAGSNRLQARLGPRHGVRNRSANLFRRLFQTRQADGRMKTSRRFAELPNVVWGELLGLERRRLFFFWQGSAGRFRRIAGGQPKQRQPQDKRAQHAL
jgi:hypothetical protein